MPGSLAMAHQEAPWRAPSGGAHWLLWGGWAPVLLLRPASHRSPAHQGTPGSWVWKTLPGPEGTTQPPTSGSSAHLVLAEPQGRAL